MKQRCCWQFGCLFLANCWVTTAVVRTAKQTAHHWTAGLEGAALPSLTTAVLHLGPGVSIVFLTLSLLGLLLGLLGFGRERLLPICFLVLVIAEIALLALFIQGMIEPSYNITYRLGGGGP